MQAQFGDSLIQALKDTTVQMFNVPRSEQGPQPDAEVKTLAGHLEVLLPLPRGQRHALPIQTGASTQSVGISLPFLDDVRGAGKQFSD